MKRIFFLFFFCFALLFLFSLKGEDKSVRIHDFSSDALLKKNWFVRGKQFGIPMTKFFIGKSAAARDRKVLVVEANSSTGVIITKVPPAVWKKYPVMRWRWRILRKVRFEKKELDDQAAVIYFGDGSAIKQFMMAYSWEHFSPLRSTRSVRYGMGTRTINRICMRNRKAQRGKWYTEERNVVEDFKKAFGREPKNICGLTVGANSQYSKSGTLVEIDYIEFCKAGKSITSPADKNRSSAERKREK